jgi:hypothetical protein
MKSRLSKGKGGRMKQISFKVDKAFATLSLNMNVFALKMRVSTQKLVGTLGCSDDSSAF